MIFTELELKGAYLIEPEQLKDERGFFARTFCRQEFEEAGIAFSPVQANLSFNRSEGTLRGMHYQSVPFEEGKLVQCIKGAIFDVIIDIRFKSPTCDQWVGIELNERNRNMLYVPEGFAHGFFTLEPNTEVGYLMSEYYTPEAARGIRWDDPLYNIEWPYQATVISEKDRNWPYRIPQKY